MPRPRRSAAPARLADARGVGVIVVIGAGVAGLAAARALVDAGRDVVVLDKGRGVGGRCATRRVEGQAVDHGVAWFHGSDPAFLCAFDGMPGIVEGWPRRVRGSGPACHPAGLEPQRFALADGASAFPKRLAAGLEVRQGVEVVGLSRRGERVEVALAGGEVLAAEDVVLALPAEQASALLAGLEPDRQVAAARFVLARAGTVACLSVIALYPLDTPDPGFDVLLPEVGGPLALLSHDSNKRVEPARRALVLQASPAWSRGHLEAEPAAWSARLLAEAASRCGAWVERPELTQAHRWRYARVDPVFALRAPLLLSVGAARVVLAGESFHAGAGVQGAFLSGRAAAARLLAG
jgi:renalase